MVAIRCAFFNEKVFIVTCYCAPSEDIQLILDSFEQLLRTFPGENVILVVDFNHNLGPPTDQRGKFLILFASNANLETQGDGWVDVLLARYCVSRISDWVMSDIETLRYH